MKVKLSKASKVLMEEIFSSYTTLELPNVLKLEFTGKVIIHIYPVADTQDNKGNLDGFYDALFFDAHIYDPKNRVKYIVTRRDGVDLDVPAKIKVFKDSSTMIVIEESVKIGPYSMLEVRRL